MPTRRRSTRSIPSRGRKPTSRRASPEALEDGNLADWYASLAAADRGISGAQPGSPSLLQACGAGAGCSRSPTASRSSLAGTTPLPAIARLLQRAAAICPASGMSQAASATIDAIGRGRQDNCRRIGASRPDGVIGETTLDALNLGPAGLARQLRSTWSACAGSSAIRRRRASTSIRPRPSSITGATGSMSIAATSSSASPTSRPRNCRLELRAARRQPEVARAGFNRRERACDQGPGLARRSNNFAIENGSYVQQSGPKNSLGLVKFDMRGYAADLPARHAGQGACSRSPERHRSHGCVRVENALQFAALLTEQDDVFDKFQEAMASGDENLGQAEDRNPGPPALSHRVF